MVLESASPLNLNLTFPNNSGTMGSLFKISEPQSPNLKRGHNKYLQRLFGTMWWYLKIQILVFVKVL